MFPKEGRRKKRRRKKRSILQKKDGTCFLCACLHGDCRPKQLEEHHVFYGQNRETSDREGLTVYLCHSHHQYAYDGNIEAIHGNPKSQDTDIFLKKIAQREYEMTHTREEFVRLIGRNYL